ncbi:hypothetical protein L596_027320 [Steinernema carpocapsae]|uniref:Histone H2A C-terminal domain-containing protein n=2 Tax=Steinernema carpocapsae TaxID=34508 RepID=A0A4U5M3Z7_STECR|nr:hypothetical protein L596_027320 [Steinernema carpocapsae]
MRLHCHSQPDVASPKLFPRTKQRTLWRTEMSLSQVLSSSIRQERQKNRIGKVGNKTVSDKDWNFLIRDCCNTNICNAPAGFMLWTGRKSTKLEVLAMGTHNSRISFMSAQNLEKSDVFYPNLFAAASSVTLLGCRETKDGFDLRFRGSVSPMLLNETGPLSEVGYPATILDAETYALPNGEKYFFYAGWNESSPVGVEKKLDCKNSQVVYTLCSRECLKAEDVRWVPGNRTIQCDSSVHNITNPTGAIVRRFKTALLVTTTERQVKIYDGGSTIGGQSRPRLLTADKPLVMVKELAEKTHCGGCRHEPRDDLPVWIAGLCNRAPSSDVQQTKFYVIAPTPAREYLGKSPTNMSGKVKKSIKSSNGKKQSKAHRAGLTFPVGRMHRILKTARYAERIGTGASIYVAAVLEYLMAEIRNFPSYSFHQLSVLDRRFGRQSRHGQQEIPDQSSPRDDGDPSRRRTQQALQGRHVLPGGSILAIFKDATFSQGGVIPHIATQLLPPKQRKDSEYLPS